jgi:hypothetical protein
MYVSYVNTHSNIHLMHGILKQGVKWSREYLSTIELWTAIMQHGSPTVYIDDMKKNCNVYKFLVCYSTTDAYLR